MRDDAAPMADAAPNEAHELPTPAAGESDRALIVLDMTIDRFRGPQAIAAAAAIVRFVHGEVRYFRERGRLIVFANAEDSSAVIQELTPRSDELCLKKPGPSAFGAPSLDAALQHRGVRRVTLVGLETHTSVLLTAADAFSRGYTVIVPDPCVTAADADAHAAAFDMLRRFWPASWPAVQALQDSALDPTP